MFLGILLRRGPPDSLGHLFSNRLKGETNQRSPAGRESTSHYAAVGSKSFEHDQWQGGVIANVLQWVTRRLSEPQWRRGRGEAKGAVAPGIHLNSN